MKRTTARLAVTVAGIGAMTGLAVGAAHADEADAPDQGTSTSDASTEQAPSGPAPNYVLQGLPGLPIGDPVSDLVFPTLAPVYGVLGSIG